VHFNFNRLAAGQREVLRVILTDVAALPEIATTVEADRRLSADRMGSQYSLSVEELAVVPNVFRNFGNLTVGSAQVSRIQGRPGFGFGGWSERLSAYEVDGGTASDPYLGGIPGQPLFTTPLPIDAIADLTAYSSPFDVRRGMIASGLFALSSRSGTNHWEANTFGTFTNQSLSGPSSNGNPSAPYDSWNIGGALAGPILKDRLHLFLNAELTRFSRPDLGPFVGDTLGNKDFEQIGVRWASADRFRRILAEHWGLDAGSLGAVNLRRPVLDVFGKLTGSLGGAGVLELSQRVGMGSSQQAARRLPRGAPYHTGSTTRENQGSITETRAVWRSQPGQAWSNELVASYRHLGSSCEPAADFPRIRTIMDEGSLLAGADSACGTTDVRQDVFEVGDNATVVRGRHVFTAGVRAERFAVSDPLLIGSQGSWLFSSLDSLEAGLATQYDRVLPGPLAPGARGIDFQVLGLGLYGQDRITLGERFTFLVGLRADLQFFPDGGISNPGVQQAFGLDTGAPPGNAILWSPRLGFHWVLGSKRGTHIRGGVGLFAGRPPLRMLSGVYRGSGGEEGVLSCRGSDVPVFDPVTQPSTCGAGVRPVGQISAYSADLHYPQVAQMALGIDHELPARFVFSGDLLVGRSVHGWGYEDVNLRGPVGAATGEAGRPLYGVIGPATVVRPDRLDPRFGTVTSVIPTSGDRTLSVSVQMLRPLIGGWGLDVGYRWNRSEDRQSLTEYNPAASLGATPLDGLHAARKLGRSYFDQGHRLFLTAIASLPFGAELSLLYTGSSGAPFSWVVQGDANADGIGGSELTGYNDLVYVPLRVESDGDITLVRGGGAPAPLSDYATLDSLIATDACLRNRRGGLAQRNGCRNGWVGFLPNLVNEKWGRYRQVTNGSSATLLTLTGWDSIAGRGIYRLNPPRTQVIENVSHWLLQFTVQYRH
jgi:hypothetical protein